MTTLIIALAITLYSIAIALPLYLNTSKEFNSLCAEQHLTTKAMRSFRNTLKINAFTAILFAIIFTILTMLFAV